MSKTIKKWRLKMTRILLDIQTEKNICLGDLLDILFNSNKIKTIDHIEKFVFKHKLYTTYKKENCL